MQGIQGIGQVATRGLPVILGGHMTYTVKKFRGRLWYYHCQKYFSNEITPQKKPWGCMVYLQYSMTRRLLIFNSLAIALYPLPCSRSSLMRSFSSSVSIRRGLPPFFGGLIPRKSLICSGAWLLCLNVSLPFLSKVS